MAVTHTLQAAFTQSIGKALVLPAGAKSMFFFGTGADGINTNRVAGGPAAITIGAPVYSANYVTCGYNGTASNVIDTNNPRNAAMLAAGWTWAAVYRCSSAGAVSGNIIADTAGAGPPLAATLTGMSFNLPTNSNIYLHGQSLGVRATFVLPTRNNSNWHFVAETYSGGAAGTLSLNEFTDVPAGSTPVTYVVSGLAVGNNSPVIGTLAPPWGTNYTYLVDCAWAMVSQGPMIQTDIAALAASVRPWLARRGIVA
jgi:hypothetical protein